MAVEDEVPCQVDEGPVLANNPFHTEFEKVEDDRSRRAVSVDDDGPVPDPVTEQQFVTEKIQLCSVDWLAADVGFSCAVGGHGPFRGEGFIVAQSEIQVRRSAGSGSPWWTFAGSCQSVTTTSILAIDPTGCWPGPVRNVVVSGTESWTLYIRAK